MIYGLMQFVIVRIAHHGPLLLILARQTEARWRVGLVDAVEQLVTLFADTQLKGNRTKLIPIVVFHECTVNASPMDAIVVSVLPTKCSNKWHHVCLSCLNHIR